ncbi:MAG: prenyltransferase/squalene oxidase repeat-containing protein [Planctomycetota bacterium]
MEQLTPGEWARAQLKRAPSFAVATVVTAALLVVCAMIEYAPASEAPPALPPVRADVEQEERQQIEEIDRNIDPEQPELEPMEDVPEAPENQTQVETEIVEDRIPVEAEFIEDDTTVTQPTDPIPESFNKRLAAISIDSGSGGFRGQLGKIRSSAGKRQAARMFGMKRGTDKAIMAGLRWLKKAQNKKTGGWDAQKWGANHRNRDAGVSGLALLAFLGYGCTDVPRGRLAEFAPTVVKAINYLIEQQEGSPGEGNEGWFGERMYSQGICTMALAEASELLQNRILRSRARRAAQAGLDYIISKQPEHGSFTYTGPGRVNPGGRSSCDVSVTGFQLQAFKAALTAKLEVPKEAIARCEKFLSINMCKDGSTLYRIDPRRYVQRGSGKVSMTAASLTGRLFLGHSRHGDDCKSQAAFLTKGDRHVQAAKKAHNLYTIYYMSLAMFNMGGRYWKEWNDAFNDALRERQVKEGPEAGSWPTDFNYGRHGGRVYTTAMACMALEVYFRYLPTYKALGKF